MSDTLIPIALFTGDVHLTEKQPLARKGEPDWIEAQHRVIEWLFSVAENKHCPVVIGGDLFDTINPSYKFLNTVYEWFHGKEVHVLLGNHEQPNKTDVGLESSAWCTAWRMNMFYGYATPEVVQGRYATIGYIPATNNEEEFQHAVDYMSKVEPDIIVMHKYVWGSDEDNPAHMGMSSHVDSIVKYFPYASYIFASDNHRGFKQGKLCNCGMLIRDNADLIDYRPRVYLLCLDKEAQDYVVETICVPVSLLAQDIISDEHVVSAKRNKEVEKLFIKTIAESKNNTISFEDNLQQRLVNQRSSDYVLNKYKEIKE